MFQRTKRRPTRHGRQRRTSFLVRFTLSVLRRRATTCNIRWKMTSTLLYAIMLVFFAVVSCSDQNSLDERSASGAIEVRQPSADKPGNARILELVTRLEDPLRMRSMSEPAILTDVKTGDRYNVHGFRVALGVRSPNEEKYLLKIYEDNSLYGLDPLYRPVPGQVPIPE